MKLQEAGAPMPRISMTHLPQQCSACFGQHSHLRHVDFEADCDRGFYGDFVPGQSPIVMDDLILCENCIGAAAGLIGYERKADRDAQLKKLQGANRRLGIEKSEADKENKQLRALVAQYYEKEKEPSLA